MAIRKKRKKVKGNLKIFPTKTVNGKLIQDCMLKNEVRGNFKDYVIILDDRLIEWTETANLPTSINGMALLHKRRLQAVIGPDLARKYWQPGIGRMPSGRKG